MIAKLISERSGQHAYVFAYQYAISDTPDLTYLEIRELNRKLVKPWFDIYIRGILHGAHQSKGNELPRDIILDILDTTKKRIGYHDMSTKSLGQRLFLRRQTIGMLDFQLGKGAFGRRGFAGRIREYERGVVQPKKASIQKLAKALSVEPEWLEFGAGSQPEISLYWAEQYERFSARKSD